MALLKNKSYININIDILDFDKRKEKISIINFSELKAFEFLQDIKEKDDIRRKLYNESYVTKILITVRKTENKRPIRKFTNIDKYLEYQGIKIIEDINRSIYGDLYDIEERQEEEVQYYDDDFCCS